MTASWYRSFCTNSVCFASSMNCAIRSRPLIGHQIRWAFSPGSNFLRCQSASKHATISSTSCLWS